MPNTTPPKRPEGRVRPRVDFGRCEGKAACVEVCPYDVFELAPLKAEDRKGLSWLARLKIAVHGGKVAYTPNAPSCAACGLCVKACPEHAIVLVPAGSAGPEA